MTTPQSKCQVLPEALNDDALWGDTIDIDSPAGMDVGGFIQYLAEAVLVVSPDGVIECANAKAALLIYRNI